MAASEDATSARRRREQRLRSRWRHERLSIAAALAEAHHHSAPKVGAVPYNAPRSQKTDPLLVAVTSYVAAGVPLLSRPSFATDESWDPVTLKFLLTGTLKAKREE